MFFILFKKRSTSSDGCPEKLIKSSNRAFRARAKIDVSVIIENVNSNVDVEVDLVRECVRRLRDNS